MSAGSSRITNLLRLTVALTVSVGWLTSAEAIDPQRVSYSRDASHLFWFVQISDSHITVGREIRVEVRTTECADGLDNNRNGLVDYPSDHGCASLGDDLEGYLILSRTESKQPVSRN